MNGPPRPQIVGDCIVESQSSPSSSNLVSISPVSRTARPVTSTAAAGRVGSTSAFSSAPVNFPLRLGGREEARQRPVTHRGHPELSAGDREGRAAKRASPGVDMGGRSGVASPRGGRPAIARPASLPIARCSSGVKPEVMKSLGSRVEVEAPARSNTVSRRIAILLAAGACHLPWSRHNAPHLRVRRVSGTLRDCGASRSGGSRRGT